MRSSTHLTSTKRALGTRFYGRLLVLVCSQMLLLGCASAYYDALESIGVHKRDIFVDRIEESLEVQKEGQAQFESALEQFKATVDFDGGGLEKAYNLSMMNMKKAKKPPMLLVSTLAQWNLLQMLYLKNGLTS